MSHRHVDIPLYLRTNNVPMFRATTPCARCGTRMNTGGNTKRVRICRDCRGVDPWFVTQLDKESA